MINALIAVPCNDEIKNVLEKKFGKIYNFVYNTKDISEAIEEAEVVIGMPEKEEIKRAKRLKWLQLVWAGADRYTKEQELMKNIILTNASGAFGVVIAEYVIGAILFQYRRFGQYWKNNAKKCWMDMGEERTLLGKRVVILGTGDIGSNIAKRLKAFDTYNIGIKRTKSNNLPYFDEIYTTEMLDTELSKADVVIGCMPNTTQTVGLFDEARLRRIKKGALLVNVGRGSMIITDALVRVLEDGYLCGAVLDVVEPEPLPSLSPLWSMDNVLITPHISGPSFEHSSDTEKFIWDICIDNLQRYADKRELNNIVDIKRGY